MDLALRGGLAVTPGGIRRVDLGIRDGRIAALGKVEPAAEEWDCRHLQVLPGIIDTQVHFREPGLEHKEDLETGTKGAALGGVTAVFEMPNTKPNTDNAERLADKVARGRDHAWVDFAFFLGATNDNAETLAPLEHNEGCAGVKVFMGASTGTLLVWQDEVLEEVLRNGRRRVAIHAEDEERLRERKDLAQGHPRTHPIWRDELSALRATQRLVTLARKTGRPVHVLHVSTAEEADFLRYQKDVVTMEVTPQHLTLTDEAYERLGTFAQMNPPIRAERHRDALWRAIDEGVVDVIGSDHAPHTREEKARPYPASPSGMPGVQTLLPLMLDHVNAGRLSLQRLVDLLCHGPQRIYGISGKGRLAVGYDADITLVDLKQRRVVRDQDMATRVGWTPFAGMELQGWPVATIVRGVQVMRDGQLLQRAAEPVRFA